MKLRDHPGMSYRGVHNWPPKWTPIGQTLDPVPTGEVGILKDVLMNDDSHPEIVLIVESKGHWYRGCLRFEDPWFCSQLFSVLKLQVERAISDIGELVIPA